MGITAMPEQCAALVTSRRALSAPPICFHRLLVGDRMLELSGLGVVSQHDTGTPLATAAAKDHSSSLLWGMLDTDAVLRASVHECARRGGACGSDMSLFETVLGVLDKV